MIFRASIPEIRESLVLPFQIHPVARFGSVRVYAYRSHGEVARHRHPEFDEVFLVYEGLVTFWADHQELTLKPDELIRIPQGMAHRSGSRVPSLVLLFRRDFMPERRNGHFPISEPGTDPLMTVRIHEQLQGRPDFTPVLLLEANAVRYQGIRGNGRSPEWEARGPSFLLLLRGEIALEATGPAWPEPVSGILAPGELAVLPRGARWRWEGQTPSVLLWVEDIM
ncbi:cupin domain-containing protein [Thermoflexus sp.]|uniref:cupin domain-containing protein n=1 Tax=Thermoflexus sp. TaxID=1969742 RepID=UPI0035E43E83